MTGTLYVEECTTNCKHFKRHKLYFVNKYSLKETDFFNRKVELLSIISLFCHTLATLVSIKNGDDSCSIFL